MLTLGVALEVAFLWAAGSLHSAAEHQTTEEQLRILDSTKTAHLDKLQTEIKGWLNQTLLAPLLKAQPDAEAFKVGIVGAGNFFNSQFGVKRMQTYGDNATQLVDQAFEPSAPSFSNSSGQVSSLVAKAMKDEAALKDVVIGDNQEPYLVLLYPTMDAGGMLSHVHTFFVDSRALLNTFSETLQFPALFILNNKELYHANQKELLEKIFAISTKGATIGDIKYSLRVLDVPESFFKMPSKVHVYVDTAEYISARTGALLAISLLLLGAIGAIIILFRWTLTRSLQPLDDSVEKLVSESARAKENAVSLSSASHELAQASSEQAAALQETAASIDEMTSMIAKNVDGAKASLESSNKCGDSAEVGQKKVGEVVAAIGLITQTNIQIMKQIDDSNKGLREVTKIITNIADKTKVINDIVFQTKLLSFNASVEAARAGEQGKGFAVVAEEVGNLAAMSGKAAREIEQMLASSVVQVDSLAKEMSEKIGRLVAEAKTNLDHGTAVAHDSASFLNEIVTNIHGVNNLVSDITVASTEQSTGIEEITKAVKQLDLVTQQNATVSHSVAGSSEQLLTQSDSLSVVAQELEKIVKGSQLTQ